MIKTELKLRARRLLEGRAKPEDLDRLVLDQRENSHGKASFRELADFLAHRDGRDKGPVTQRVRDVFSSFRVWSLGLRGLKPTLDDIATAGLANLNLLSEEELKFGCNLRRDVARQKFDKALRAAKAGQPVSHAKLQLIDFLANRFLWKPAFTGDELFEDFVEVSMRNQVLDPADRRPVEQQRDFLLLYAMTRLHGAAIQIEQGRVATLYAGFANSEKRLEVRVDIASQDWPKRVHAPICMFSTKLAALEHCAAELLVEMPMWNSWTHPVELGTDGKLHALV